MIFAPEEREGVKQRIIEMGRADRRIVAAALVGSTADGGDRWSDLDITFGLAPDTTVEEVLSDWTEDVRREFDAVHLFDLSSGPALYRVFLFRGCLQVDLSFTPGAAFGATGPRFKLLFGRAVEKPWDKPITAQSMFGYAVHHLIRARICVEHKKMWQAECWISAARDNALALACLHRGLNTSYGRGFDQLPEDVTKRFVDSLVGSLDKDVLLSALGRIVDELFRNPQDVGELSKIEEQLRSLASTDLD